MTTTGCVDYNPVAGFEVPAGAPGAHEALRLCSKGREEYARGRVSESAESFSLALQAEPRCRGAYYALAVCFAKSGRFEDALSFLDRELGLPRPHLHAGRLRRDLLARALQLPEAQAPAAGEPSAEARGACSIFTVPKPFTGLACVIQRNAIRSWLQLKPRPEVILLGDEEGVAEAAAEFSLVHLPQVTLNDFGTPRVDSLFELAQARTAHDLMAYVNTDIILFQDFAAALMLAAASVPDFLMVGRRFDLDVWEELDLERQEVERELRVRAKKEGGLHRATGIDYLAFRKGLFRSIPPFAVGRTAWDNWLLASAKERGARLVDATRMVFALHQEHAYGHARGGVVAVWRGEEAVLNRKLAGGAILTIDAADIALQAGEVIPAREACSLPIPSDADICRLKLQQAERALDFGMTEHCADLLDYVEQLMKCRPSGLQLLRGKVALANGSLREAADALQGELDLCPGNADAERLLRMARIALQKEGCRQSAEAAGSAPAGV